jgi:hypothetical protein
MFYSKWISDRISMWCCLRNLAKQIDDSIYIYIYLRSNLLLRGTRVTRVPRVTRLLPLVEQELLALPEHVGSHPVFCRARVAQSLFFCVMFCRSLFVLFILATVFRFTTSDYPLISFTHSSPCESNTNEDLFYRVLLSLLTNGETQ